MIFYHSNRSLSLALTRFLLISEGQRGQGRKEAIYMNFSGAAKPFRKLENIPAKDLEVHHWFCTQGTQYSCLPNYCLSLI